MTSPSLTDNALSKLQLARDIAIENLEFYTCLYDGLEKVSEKEHLGQAMVQKQSFIGAVEAILKNHGLEISELERSDLENDCDEILQDPELGEHLSQEHRFSQVLESCIAIINDELTTSLLQDHLNAAELAVASIKSTSLKI